MSFSRGYNYTDDIEFIVQLEQQVKIQMRKRSRKPQFKVEAESE